MTPNLWFRNQKTRIFIAVFIIMFTVIYTNLLTLLNNPTQHRMPRKRDSRSAEEPVFKNGMTWSQVQRLKHLTHKLKLEAMADELILKTETFEHKIEHEPLNLNLEEYSVKAMEESVNPTQKDLSVNPSTKVSSVKGKEAVNQNLEEPSVQEIERPVIPNLENPSVKVIGSENPPLKGIEEPAIPNLENPSVKVIGSEDPPVKGIEEPAIPNLENPSVKVIGSEDPPVKGIEEPAIPNLEEPSIKVIGSENPPLKGIEEPAIPNLENPSVKVIGSENPPLKGIEEPVIPNLENPSVKVIGSENPPLKGIEEPAIPNLEDPSIQVIEPLNPNLEDPSIKVIEPLNPNLKDPSVKASINQNMEFPSNEVIESVNTDLGDPSAKLREEALNPNLKNPSLIVIDPVNLEELVNQNKEKLSVGVIKEPINPNQNKLSDEILDERKKTTEDFETKNIAGKSDLDQEPSDVILNAYMRSGSTILGKLLGNRLDTFYTFEPLWNVAKFQFYNGPMLYCHYFQPYCSEITTQPASEVKTLNESLGYLQSIFNCSFHDYSYFFKDTDFKENQNEDNNHDWSFHKGKRWLDYKNCKQNPSNTLKTCLRAAEPGCISAKHRIIKLLRMTLDNLELLLQTNKHLKVVHLFRDPRAIINSHINTGWFGYDQYDPIFIVGDAGVTCQRMMTDIQAGKRLLQKYPGRIKIIQYEDVGNLEPDKMKRLYAFLGMSFTIQEDTLIRKVKLPRKNSGVKGFHPYNYRETLSWKVVETVDRECSEVITELGYQLYRNEQHLRNMSHPAATNPLPYIV